MAALMQNNIFLLSNIDFQSETGASYARIVNYSQALSSEGTKVILTSKLNYLTKENELLETGIKNVTYLGLPKPRFKKKLNDIYLENLYFLAYYKYLKKVYKLASTTKGNCVYLLYPGTFALMLVALIYLKIIRKQKVFIEKNEMMTGIALNYPLQNNPVKFILLSLIKAFLVVFSFLQDLLTPCFTGIIAISTSLENLYHPFNSRIIRVPILCEPSTALRSDNKNKRFAIGYTGDINQNKDGLFSFMQVLGKIITDCEFDFYIWGSSGDRKQLSLLTKLIEDSGLTDFVHFQGYIKSNELKTAISKLDLLVLPRPLNIQTKYGFSTKLGEYLISGIPVLVTDVSDNNIYIEDGINGFIVESGNQAAMLERLKGIMKYPEIELRKIGFKGRETAFTHFDYMKYATVLNSFLFN